MDPKKKKKKKKIHIKIRTKYMQDAQGLTKRVLEIDALDPAKV